MNICFCLFSLCGGLLTPCLCYVEYKKTECEVKDQIADCSHLKLKEVPSYLPDNITGLDVSHNQLRELPTSVMSQYKQLVYLNAGFNSIKKIQQGLCQTLPLLRELKLEHNEVYELSEKDFTYCSNLSELNLSSNKIKIKGDPFGSLENLRKLDVSRNDLTTANLGTHPQLQNLQELILSGNKISVLKKDEFSCLSNTSLKLLELSSLPLKQFEPGCFHSIGQLYGLVMDHTKLDSVLAEKLCNELSGTALRNLSLQGTTLSKILSSTFKGLKATNLTALDLSKNGLSTINDGSFQWLQKLEYLSLEENSIAHLTKNTFANLTTLNFLNLKKALTKHKKTPILDDFSFQWFINLEHLLMDGNVFGGITEETFTGLKSLKYLSLSSCSMNMKTITNKTLYSLAQSPLVFLNLTGIGISKLENGAFTWFRNLSKLYMGHNAIIQTLTGEEFRGLSSIEEIFLSYNQKITLSSSSFIHTPTLRTLMLGRTLSGTLDLSPSPFQPLQNLTVLDLSNNNIANINEALFSGLQHLKILKMQHNNLARLWKNGNPGGPLLFLKGLVSLRILQLDSNGLDEIPVDAFRGLYKLVQLDLGPNNLNVLPKFTFDDLTSLRVLNLQKNLITSVENGVFETVFKNLQTLYLGKNPFDCTCESMFWFVNWLNKTNTSVPRLNSQYVCNTPPSFYNSSVSLFDTSPCKDLAPFKSLFIFSASFLLVFLVSVIFIRFQGWRIEFFWNVSVNRILGYTEVDIGENRFEYDAYIICAPTEEDLVERNFTPFENIDQGGYQFCYGERDFAAGVSQLDAVVESMSRSRKIIFVVTEALLKDPWCRRFKVHHAIHQVIEQSRDSIVLIFLEDIPDYKLYQSLFLRRGMIKSCCILHWPVQRDRVKAFRQKMKVALGSSNRMQQ